MSIEIYDKAKIIHKDNRFYFLLKHGSKNSYTCAHQKIVDDKLHNKYIKRDSRDSHWSIIAEGNEDALTSNTIGDTSWNAPTSSVYGQIRFGNHKNIALWYARNKHNWTDYAQLDEVQQKNFDSILSWYSQRKENLKDSDIASPWTINLDNIHTDQKLKVSQEYCGETYNIAQHSIVYEGMPFWDFDNL